MDALSLITPTRATLLGAVTLGAVALGAMTLRAVAAASSATAARAWSDAFLQLLQLETDMPHGFSPPFIGD